MPKSQEQTILDLRDELDEAREIIRQLNTQLRDDRIPLADYIQAFDLTKLEARVFSLLMKRESMLAQNIRDIVWPDRDVCYSLVSCLIHKIRRKMNRRDVSINLVHGLGYSIPPPMKRKVQKLVEDWDAAGQPSCRHRLQHQHRNSSVVEDHG